MATSDQMAVLSALSKADGPVVLEEIAAMASISFERAWYTVLELIELRFISMAGISIYVVTARESRQQIGLRDNKAFQELPQNSAFVEPKYK